MHIKNSNLTEASFDIHYSNLIINNYNSFFFNFRTNELSKHVVSWPNCTGFPRYSLGKVLDNFANTEYQIRHIRLTLS